MPVPTLPGTHWSAPQGFFIIPYIFGNILWILPLFALFATGLIAYCRRRRAAICTPRNYCLLKLQALLDQAFTLGYRKIFVAMFPSLFKEHKDRYKDRSNNGTATRVFILFLDRRVEKNFKIIAWFCVLAFCICVLAMLVFFCYFPVAISGECFESDDKNRDLYCYIINSSNNTWDSLPVDCAAYNSTELEEIEFVCYAITIFDFGIGLAAAGALAKLATVSITIYIRVSAAVYKWSRGNKEQYCGLSAKRIYTSYLVGTLLALSVLAIISYSVFFTVERSRPAAVLNQPSYAVYIAYAMLPILLYVPLVSIMLSLGKHCSQEEYISYCIHQMPDCEDDRDVHVEPANNHEEHEESDHEAGNDWRSSTPDQAEGTQLNCSQQW